MKKTLPVALLVCCGLVAFGCDTGDGESESEDGGAGACAGMFHIEIPDRGVEITCAEALSDYSEGSDQLALEIECDGEDGSVGIGIYEGWGEESVVEWEIGESLDGATIDDYTLDIVEEDGKISGTIEATTTDGEAITACLTAIPNVTL